MKSFFDKFDKEQKFNLFVGDFLNKISGYPTRNDITEAILSEIKQPAKSYVQDMNSLADIVQAYLDAVIDTKVNLIRQIRENYGHRFNTSLDIYKDILTSGYFQNIFSINFDTVLDTNFSSMLARITPLEKSIPTSDQIKYYKIFGDITSMNNIFISSQDIRKLKVLGFYKEFFNSIREEFKNYPTLFLGVNLEDSDLIDILDFILKPLKEHEPIYIVSYSSIISSKSAEFIGKYDVKLISADTTEFIDFFREKSSRIEGELAEKKFVW
ncbi:hypothetical protein IX317_000065 [Fusobacterium sp. DD29]|uniref:SIR2 family protein n=1 Tax=unclassified Fusobacterium TaxID=2648384 RepID=UPI001B8CAC6E|nr:MULTISPECIES: SIR2 family protein [unclassified Fusobacterium]MBR8701178.1 hypothetical protein [Fusobacterium sp. DD45]MBR8711939.1 hypothetical protein [Fusobacterium sp. DD28]MBR8748408.1 hypothetical protein [Fusobacterium sp. DD29]MBR8752512.1 hypothetical protein [Fusobacterium sp. DD26]MBR8760618.1 hypothetical protein [Fusobacterium sp. DD25]